MIILHFERIKLQQIQISGKEITTYADFLATRVGLASAQPIITTPRVTIIDRKTDRKILNFDTVVSELKRLHPNLEVQTAYLEELSMKEQIDVLRKTTLLIGMHGSGIGNIIFLPKDAAVIEVGFTL